MFRCGWLFCTAGSLGVNRRRKVGDGESPTCFGSARRILRPVFGQIGGKLVVSDVLRPILAHVRTKYSNTQHRSWDTPPRYPGTPHNHKKQKLFTFFFPRFCGQILRDTIFSNTGHCGQDYKSERPVSQRTQSRRTMFMSDCTQDRLDRLNSSHSERDFSMANNPLPNLGRSPQRTHAMV